MLQCGDQHWQPHADRELSHEDAREIVFGESPDWSPVANRIVFRGCGTQCEVWGLYVTDDQGSTQELLLADPSATAPAWSRAKISSRQAARSGNPPVT